MLSKDSARLKELATTNQLIAVEICRLLIARNVLSSFTAMFLASLDDPRRRQKVFADGDRLVHFLYTVAVVKEALDSFLELDRCKWLQEQKLLKNNPRYQEIRNFLKNTVSSKDQNGFYKRFIEPTRCDAAFHWSRDKLGKAIGSLLERNVTEWPKLLLAYSPKVRDSAYPLANQLLIRLPEWDVTHESMEHYVRVMAEVVSKITDFADALVTLIL